MHRNDFWNSMVFLCTARSVNIVSDTVTSLWFHQLNLDSRIKQAATMHNTSKQNPAQEITSVQSKNAIRHLSSSIRLQECHLHDFLDVWRCVSNYNLIKLYQNPPKKHRPTWQCHSVTLRPTNVSSNSQPVLIAISPVCSWPVRRSKKHLNMSKLSKLNKPIKLSKMSQSE